MEKTAVKSAKKEAPQDEEKKVGESTAGREVATTSAGSGALTALDADMGDEVGLGTSTSADDNIIPFITVLQDMSPQVKKRDEAYVEGAEPGCLFNTATKQLWIPDEETGLLLSTEGDPLVVQPCAFVRAVAEWIPRDAGGGFVARHPHDKPTIEETLKSLGGDQVPDSRDSTGRKKIWRVGNNDLIDTRYHYANILHPDGRTEPVVLSFASTGHTTSREWMTALNNLRLPSGRKPHSFFSKWNIRARTKKNTQGEWFVLSMVFAGWVEDKHVRDVGRELHEAVNSGKVKAAAETAQTQSEADVPI